MKVTVLSNSRGDILGITHVEEEAREQGIVAELVPKRGQKVYEVTLPQGLGKEPLFTIYNEYRLDLKDSSPRLKKKRRSN